MHLNKLLPHILLSLVVLLWVYIYDDTFNKNKQVDINYDIICETGCSASIEIKPSK